MLGYGLESFVRLPVLTQAPAEPGPMSQFAAAMRTGILTPPLRCHSERSRQLSIVGGENPTLGRARSGISQAQVTMGPISLSQWCEDADVGEPSLEKRMFYVEEPSLEKVPPRPFQEHSSAWFEA